MSYGNIIHLLDTFMWLMACIIPFLVLMVVLSCWFRNKAHQTQHEIIEQVMMNQLESFNASGHWPTAQTDEQRKAMKMLAKRFDIHDDLMNGTTPP